MKKITLFVFISVLFVGCATVTPPPKWNETSMGLESEYTKYQVEGTGSVSGQAFLSQQGGGTVKAAGNNVTLDPATSVGNEWWGKAAIVWVHRALTPPSANFHKTRRTTVADADGRFKFKNIPTGRYYVRTEVTWMVPTRGIQGGIVGRLIEVKDGETTELILNQYAK